MILMKRSTPLFSIAVIAAILMLSSCTSKEDVRKISLEEYQSKMKAGWLGQMAGVGWGAPTEFKYNAMIIPEEDVPEWKDGMINQQWQDDIYVEMTFLKTLEDHGFDVSIRQAGIDFANSQYMLWHANYYGRAHLRAGIAPPYSGHPMFNSHADDIDYQIEADYSGLIAPGMPQAVVDLGDKFGRIMNYGDGVYGGQFVGAMYAEAFFETDIHKIIEAGLACIPDGSQYAEAIKDVIAWHKEDPINWQATWQKIEDKYNLNPEYRKFSCSGTGKEFNIDAKLNGAYIVMGLVYGNGDMDKTIVISMRCGADSDCNPSNAAGVLATSLGMENLPEQYKTGIDDTTNFSYTAYNFPSLLEVCEKLTREALVIYGGSVETEDGDEVFIIPVKEVVIGELEQCWEPSEVVGDVNFTAEEMAQIHFRDRKPSEYVTAWQVAATFGKDGADPMDLLNIEFAPETDNTFNEWKDMPAPEGTKEMDLYKYSASENCVGYLRTKVWIEEAQDVIFEVGSDDGIKIWLNGQVVHDKNVNRGHMQGDDLLDVSLESGWNEVMMKVSQGVGGWAASMIITDTEHNVIEGLKFE